MTAIADLTCATLTRLYWRGVLSPWKWHKTHSRASNATPR